MTYPALPHSEIVLALKPLRDAGGIERGLNMRLTTALSRFLNDQKMPQVRLMGSAAQSAPGSHWTLEGDVSCATGRGEDNARFLIVVRLYRDEVPRTLIGQWTGTATSLRCLTVNLRHDPRFHSLGLIGELGSRIVVALAAEQTGPTQRWRSLLQLATGRCARVDITAADNPEQTLREIPTAKPFRLRASAAASHRAYLVLFDRYGTVTMAKLTPDGNSIAGEDGKSALSQPIALPDGVVEAWAVCSLTNKSEIQSIGDNPSSSSSQVSTRISRHRYDNCPDGFDDDAPVKILDGVGSINPQSDSAADRLLADISRKPMLWCLVRFRVAGRR